MREIEMLCVCASVWGVGMGRKGSQFSKAFNRFGFFFFLISTEKDADSEEEREKEPCEQV